MRSSTSSPLRSAPDDVLDLVLGDARAFLVHLQLDDARLVVERPRGAVLDGLADVVDVRVLAEDVDRVLVVALQRRAGEADEGGVGQRLAHPARAALDEAVLAAVRLVGHDHHVGALRDHAVRLGELLDGREHHAARRAVEQRLQMLPAFGLHRGLPQQRAPGGEGVEELVVEIVAVGDHDDRRVGQARLADQRAGQHQHGQRLARALGVPDHAAAPVALTRGRPQARQHAGPRLAHRAELVVARDLLGDLAALVLLEGDAGAQVVDQRPRLEQPPDQRLQRRRAAAVVVQRSPGHEAAASAGDRADAGQHPVRDRQHQVRHEQVRRGLHVAVELVDGDAEVGLGVGRVLQLDDRDRQTVQEHRQVRADDLARRPGDAELAHHQQIVRGRVVEVDEARARRRASRRSSASRYSTSTPSVSSAWNQRLFWISVGCGGRDRMRTTSSTVSCGRSGLSRRMTPLNTVVRITSPGPNWRSSASSDPDITRILTDSNHAEAASSAVSSSICVLPQLLSSGEFFNLGSFMGGCHVRHQALAVRLRLDKAEGFACLNRRLFDHDIRVLLIQDRIKPRVVAKPNASEWVMVSLLPMHAVEKASGGVDRMRCDDCILRIENNFQRIPAMRPQSLTVTQRDNPVHHLVDSTY